ncbi:MAG: hypothetical protein KDC84_11945 [Crocinitomicaceae bacterium]|nr:hypothetical protein [Crocinitomicaceae bacterium]
MGIKNILIIFSCLFIHLNLIAQDSTKVKAGGPSESELAAANNPLADTYAVNIQDYFIPKIYGADGAYQNQAWLRVAIPTWRILWRLSMPFSTISMPDKNGNPGFHKSGIGDADLFAAFLAVMKPKITFGIGPSFGFPTSSDPRLGTGKYSAGLATVIFAAPGPKFQIGGLIIWKKSFAERPEAIYDSKQHFNVLAIQPFYFFQLGKGFYLRGAPIWTFELTSGTFNIPLGLGVGKVAKFGPAVFNFFIEPQVTILHHGDSQPAFQVLAGMNMQFKGKSKKTKKK